jgi:hypothetical protein
MQKKMFDRFESDVNTSSSVEIIHHEDRKAEDRLIIIGSLKNISTDIVDDIELEAEFFKDDIFVDECTEYISWKIHPGEIENFKVSCGGCSNNYTATNYDTYTLKIRR